MSGNPLFNVQSMRGVTVRGRIGEDARACLERVQRSMREEIERRYNLCEIDHVTDVEMTKLADDMADLVKDILED